MKVVLLHNPRSGTAPSLKDLRRYFKQASIDISVEIAIQDGFERKLKRHLRKGQIIAAVGGDGTMSTVAQLMKSTDAILAPLPGGTLNHFTKDLGINQDLEKAIQAMTVAAPRRIDYAMVNDRVFINNSSIGLYPSSLQSRARIEDKFGKWPAAVIGSIRAWLQYRLYNVTVGGKDVSTPFIFIGNNDYHIEHSVNNGRKYVDKGMLSIYTITATSRWEFLKLIGRALTGKLADVPELQTYKTTEVTIHSRHDSLRVAYDGEFTRLQPPLTYKIVPGGLKIIGS